MTDKKKTDKNILCQNKVYLLQGST